MSAANAEPDPTKRITGIELAGAAEVSTTTTPEVLEP